MTQKERKLAGELLDMASDLYSNHGCNDLDDELFYNWTKQERQELMREYHQWNGDPEEYDPKHVDFPDWMLMMYLAHKLKTE